MRRALASVIRQKVPVGVLVDVIVIDDGSPVPAHLETTGLSIQHPFQVRIIEQPNSGVASARNRGLKTVPENCSYIAFLDSDDSWQEDHLQWGIAALEDGHDFYFCDNRRSDNHDSFFLSHGKLTRSFITGDAALVSLPPRVLESLVLREFPAQASTVLYRRSIAPNLLFDESFRNAGEDLTFLIRLAQLANKACFSTVDVVTCGVGVNIYFGNLDWNSEKHLSRIVDLLRAHRNVQMTVKLARQDYTWNRNCIAGLRRDLVFHTVRKFIRSRGAWPQELRRIAVEDKWFAGWFAVSFVQVSLGKLLGLYRPE